MASPYIRKSLNSFQFPLLRSYRLAFPTFPETYHPLVLNYNARRSYLPPICSLLFLLSLFLPASSIEIPNPDPVIIRDSCIINPLGTVIHQRVYQDKGCPLHKQNLSFSILPTETNLQVSTPFWLGMGNSNWHFSLPSRIIMDAERILRFSPDSVYLPNLRVFVASAFWVTVTNVGKEPIDIFEIASFSRDMFIDANGSVGLNPGKTFRVRVFVCPTRGGPFSSLLGLGLQRGWILYRVGGWVDRGPDTIALTPLSYQWNGLPMVSQVFLPRSFAPRFEEETTIIYDSRIFFRLECHLKDFSHIQLHPFDIAPGFYWTFLHLVRGNDIRSYPLCISVSAHPLQPAFRTIYLPLVTAPDGSSSAEILIMNPTDRSYNLTAIKLPPDAPRNLFLEVGPFPVCCLSLARTGAGRLVLSGARPGRVSTHLSVVVKTNNRNHREIHIAVSGSVEYGSLEPKPHELHIEQHGGAQGVVTFVNRFAAPVLAVAAFVNSSCFDVVDFAPFIVPPGAQSPPVFIRFVGNALTAPIVAPLSIETNATTVRVTIRGYSKKLLVGRVPARTSHGANAIFVRLGRVPSNSVLRLPLYVQNARPTALMVTDFGTSEGVSAFTHWNRSDDMSLEPFVVHCLNMEIRFLDGLPPIYRNDTVWIGQGRASVHVVVTWAPVTGTIIPQLPISFAIFGVHHNVTLMVESTYAMALRVRNVTSGVKGLTLTPIPNLIRARRPTAIAEFSLMMTPDHIRIDSVRALFENYRNLTSGRKAWNRAWREAAKLEIDIDLFSSAGTVLTMKIPLKLASMRFGDMHLHVGYIASNTEIWPILNLHNSHDCDLAFHGATFDVVLRPHDWTTIRVPIRVGDPGPFNLSYPITTNLTAPFIVYVTGTATSQRAQLRNLNGEQVSELRFTGTVRESIVYLTNVGDSNLTVDNLSFNGGVFRMTSACAETVWPGKDCELVFSVDFDRVQQPIESFEWTLPGLGEGNVIRLVAEPGKDFHRVSHIKVPRPSKRIVSVVWGTLALSFFRPFWRRFRTAMDARRRKNALKRAVDTLSDRRLKPIGTQARFEPMKLAGTWVSGPHSIPLVTDASFAAMSAIIAQPS
jgi:hypothetical protein